MTSQFEGHVVKTHGKTKLFAFVVVCVLGILYWGFRPVGDHTTKYYQSVLRSLMKDLILEEEVYFANSGAYTADIEAMDLVVPESVNFQIELLPTNTVYMGIHAFAESKEIDYTYRMLMSPIGEPLLISPDSLVESLEEGFEYEWGVGS